ncbi:20177_t:CDS:2, partial [Racocetra persica]
MLTPQPNPTTQFWPTLWFFYYADTENSSNEDTDEDVDKVDSSDKNTDKGMDAVEFFDSN